MLKFLPLLVFLGFSLTAFTQATRPNVEIGSNSYDSLKALNLLDFYNVLAPENHQEIDASGAQPILKGSKKKGGIKPKSSGCNCYIDPDPSYTLALAPNDDGSSPLIPLPFDFCFYGDTVNSLYINNNGNITFGSSLFSFSSTAFPSNGNQIIAPFWADVDTRGGNGQVLYKITPTAIYINWVDVGYYNTQGDKRNTFQLILTDGADPVINGGNVAFCYEDMQWTTGSASQGVNGFGGVPATAGANKGNNVDYFLIARFDHPGTDFDGALGNNDGISWLDYKSFFFDVCNTNNIPPIPNGLSVCDTFRICAIGDTADYPLIFLSPEANQITSLSVNNGGLTSLTTVINNSGNTAEMVIRAWGTPQNAGTYSVSVTATDNYSPPGVTTLTFTIVIDSVGVSNINPEISPDSGCDSVVLQVLNGPYDSYLWSNLVIDSSITINTSTNNVAVTVEKNGCFKRVTKNISVAPSFNLNMQGDLNLCPGVNSTYVYFPDSTSFGPIDWGIADSAQNSHYSNILNVGTYTVSVDGPMGICTRDTTFTITNLPAIAVPADDSICGTQQVVTATGGSGLGYWTSYPASPAPIFQSPNSTTTNVQFPSTATYHLVYNDLNCPSADTMNLTVSVPINLQLNGSNFFCPNDPGSFYQVVDSARYGSVTWGAAPGLNGFFSHILGTGNYTVSVVDTAGICSASTSFTVSSQPKILLAADTVICDSTLLMATNQGGSGNGKWSVLSGPGNVTFVDSALLNQGLSFGNFGNYVLIYRDLTCPDSDTIQVRYSAGPDIVTNNPDYFICPGQTENIKMIDSTNLSSISWGLSDPGKDSLFSVQLGAGTYTVTIVDLYGCTNDSSFTIDQQQKIILENITELCGDEVELMFNIGVEGGLWYKLTGPGDVTFAPTDSLKTLATFSIFGDYQLVYTESNCNDADTINLAVTFYPYSEVPDYLGCIGTTQEVQAFDYYGNGKQYLWSNGQTGPTATLTEGGTYTLTTINDCGSQDYTFLYDARPCDIEMPNVFTPNGDGANALFKPIDATKSAFPEFDCKIFNRWGKLLFEFNDLDTGWDGRTNSGDIFNDGVYFYTVRAKNIDGDLIEKQGFFHLIND